MNYIVVALKAEAQAFVDAFNLTKSKLSMFTLYANADMKLIISGMGVTNARLATQTFINHFDITDEDVYYNIGICAASNAYEIGEVLKIGSIVYDEMCFVFDGEKKELICLDEPADEAKYEIVDMESYGFYDAVKHNPAIKKFHIIKVVSDHFEPQSISKDGAKRLLFKNIEKIFPTE